MKSGNNNILHWNEQNSLAACRSCSYAPTSEDVGNCVV